LFHEDIEEFNLNKLDNSFSTDGKWITDEDELQTANNKVETEENRTRKWKPTPKRKKIKKWFRNVGGSGLLRSWRYAGSFAAGFPGEFQSSY
jgi:hypothetical protein